MNSSKTLLGMLSELHSMEAKFALALMESTLKLVSLADANIFILVEAEDNRRYYGGKKHLCDAFASGVLYPEATDVEVETNVEISSLSPKYPHHQTGDGMAHDVRPFAFLGSDGADELYEGEGGGGGGEEEGGEEPLMSYEEPTSNSWKTRPGKKRKPKTKPSAKKNVKSRRVEEAAVINEEQAFEITPRDKNPPPVPKPKLGRLINGPTRRSAVYDFYLEEGNKFKCLVVDGDTPCYTEIASIKSGGGQSGNLKRHLKRRHPEEFELVRGKDEIWKNGGPGCVTLNDDEMTVSISHCKDEPWTHNGVPIELDIGTGNEDT